MFKRQKEQEKAQEKAARQAELKALRDDLLAQMESLLAKNKQETQEQVSRDLWQLRQECLKAIREENAAGAFAIAASLEAKVNGLLAVLDKPLEQMPASVSRIFYQGILRKKGMAGDPVICDACGSVFSSFWDHCDNCLKRKADMPPSSFPEAK